MHILQSVRGEYIHMNCIQHPVLKQRPSRPPRAGRGPHAGRLLAGGVRLDDDGGLLDRRRTGVPDEIAESDDDREEAAGHRSQRPHAARTHPGKHMLPKSTLIRPA